MKKIINLILLIVTILILNPSDIINANDIGGTFVGTVDSKHDLCVGDIPDKDDFVINGYIDYDGVIYRGDDLYLWFSKDKITEGQTILKVYIFVSQTTNIPYDVNINTIPFSPELTSELDDKEIVIDKIKWYSDDGFDIINYYDELTQFALNKAGKNISGYYDFSRNLYNPKVGYNVIVYKFTPSKKYSKYDTIYGNFVVYYNDSPKITATATTLNIGLNNKNNSYKIKINNRWYKTTQIKNLKPNTTYEIKIVQNATEEYKSKVIYTKKIKTKKK